MNKIKNQINTNPFFSKLFAINIVIYVFLFLIAGSPIVKHDGFYYYHVAKSMVTYGSFVSPERPGYDNYEYWIVNNHRGNYVDVVSPGTSILIYPFILAANILNPGLNTYNDYFTAYYGNNYLEGLFVLIFSVVISLISIILIYKSLRLLGYSEKLSSITTYLTYISSLVVTYVFLSPFYNHNYEVFILSLGLWSFLKYYKANIKKQNLYLILGGVSTGTIFLIRPNFAILGILFGLVMIYSRNFIDFAKFSAVNIPFIITWMLYNFVSYGKLVASGYYEIRRETFNFEHFHLVDLLFSNQGGLLVYSPIMLIGIFGLVLLYRRDVVMSFISVSFVGIVLLAYSFWPTWWGAYSYGARFLMVLTPFAAIGLAELIYQYRLYFKGYKSSYILYTTLFFMVAWSSFLTVLYRFTPFTELHPGGGERGVMSSLERQSPRRLFEYNYEQAEEADSLGEYIQTLANKSLEYPNIFQISNVVRENVFRIQDLEEYTKIGLIYNDEDKLETNDYVFYIHDGEKIYEVKHKFQDSEFISIDELLIDNVNKVYTDPANYPQILVDNFVLIRSFYSRLNIYFPREYVFFRAEGEFEIETEFYIPEKDITNLDRMIRRKDHLE